MENLSAFSLLRDGELCEILLQSGEWREVTWSEEMQCFFYVIHGDTAMFPRSEVEEWRPASVKF
jgi:hypothetical protein